MTASILAFPSRPADRERLTMVGQTIASAIPPPEPDPELTLLLELGAKLLDSLNEQELDRWLARVAEWEAGKPR